MFHNQSAEDSLTKPVLVGYCLSIACLGPFAAEIGRSKKVIFVALWCWEGLEWIRNHMNWWWHVIREHYPQGV